MVNKLRLPISDLFKSMITNQILKVSPLNKLVKQFINWFKEDQLL